MSVAPATFSNVSAGAKKLGFEAVGELAEATAPKVTNEALMILGVDGEIGDVVKKELVAEKGVLNVSSITL